MEHRSTVISEFPLRKEGSSRRPGRGWCLLTSVLGLILASSVSIPSFAAPSAPNLRSVPGSVPAAFETKVQTLRLLSDSRSEIFSQNARDLDDCHPAGYRSGSQTVIACHHGSARLHQSKDQWPFFSANHQTVPDASRNRSPDPLSGFKTIARSVPIPPPLRS